jgi:hypothetical protein
MSSFSVNNATHWIDLNTLSNPSPSESPSNQSTSHTLPVLVEHTPLFRDMKSNPKQRAPYIEQLNGSIGAIKQFITEHAQNSPSKTSALKNLELYAVNRINCSGSDLKAITLNNHRSNLNLFVEALQNPSIPLDKKISAATGLAQGLGVCHEGENLNIYEQTAALHSKQTGLSNKILEAKNALIDQNLLQLVRHEAAEFMHPRQAQALEIHQVQALKNHLADQWGLVAMEDKHASATYQQQAGKMAQALLEQTVTPAAVAQLLAQQLRETIVNLRQGIDTGIDASTLDYDVLKQHMELEFGNNIALADCLDTSDDYSSVTVKTEQELTELVLESFKTLGLIDKNVDIAEHLKTPAPEFHTLIHHLEPLRDNLAVHNTWTTIQHNAKKMNAMAHLSGSLFMRTHPNEDDKEKKKHGITH